MEEKTGGLCPVSECGLLAKTESVLRTVISSWVDKAGRARKPRSLTRKDWKNGWGGICVFLYLPFPLFTGVEVEGCWSPPKSLSCRSGAQMPQKNNWNLLYLRFKEECWGCQDGSVGMVEVGTQTLKVVLWPKCTRGCHFQSHQNAVVWLTDNLHGQCFKLILWAF